ncbi:hypothetical protein HMPREF9056_02650 [Actinomyces sp. oral taxon 170 str. F0386]|nr:hypothetical protein HMPREF9056_02650 [Actinomyces sp. oral taxon 170 str. F0386]
MSNEARSDRPRHALSGRHMTRDRLPGTGPPAQAVVPSGPASAPARETSED